MQINRIDNNTNFNAKFNIKGYTKDIKKSQIDEWIRSSKLIGSDSDTITLNLGIPTSKEEITGMFSNSKKYIIKSRQVRMLSNINDKKDEKIFSYYTSEKVDVHSRMLKRISDYLDKLAQKSK